MEYGPMIPEEVGREMSDSLKKTNSLLATMVRQNAPAEVDWLMLEEYAHEGIFGDLYSWGDKFIDTWRDAATSQDYTFPWRLNHIGSYELADGELLINRPCLQLHYASPFGVQFSHPRAFLACPEGLSAGTYTIHFAQTWSKLTDLDWKFTLTQDVPAGGRLSGFQYMADSAYVTRPVYSHSADGKTIIETVEATKGIDGTDLGTLNYTTRNGNLNCMQETFYGWNRWKYSALRQYLNSSAGVGNWWNAQDEWDIAPDQLTTKAGFLSGCSEAMINAIKTVKVKTYVNTVQGGTSEDYDITYDKVFLPSLEEMYITPQKAGEGDVHEYWRRASGRTEPFAWSTSYPELVHYAVENHTSAQNVRLRSAYRTTSINTWLVNSSGSVSYYYAYGAFRFSPLVVL